MSKPEQSRKRPGQRRPFFGAPAEPLALLLCLLAFMPAALGAPSLTARLDREVVPVGENVTLSLIFEGASPGGAPSLPALPNLQHTGDVEKSRAIINGQVTRETYSYTMVAAQPGDITIPPLQIRVEGKVLTSQPLRLKIVQGRTAANPNAAVTNVAFVRLIVPKNEVYLGEPFPVEIQLYFQNAQDVRMPQLQAEGFSLGQNAQPTQSRTQVGNAVFNLVVFKMSATAARTGTLSLGPAECSLTLLIPVNNQRRADPFFDFFGGNVQRRPTTLTSEPQSMRVLPLPKENVPAGFNGAVGHFDMKVNVGPTNLAVGDPITVRVEIAGRGLLDALGLPAQPQWRDFKTYPPTSSVQLNDPIGLSGVKSFEQVVIPQNHEIKELPPFQFSYFDSDQKAYRTLTHPATPLTVRPSALMPTPPPSLTNSVAASTPPAPPTDDIEHIRARLDKVGPPQAPLIQRAWFLSLQGLPPIVWLTLLMLRKRNESLANNPRLRRQREVTRRVREGLEELHSLAASQQSEAFFAALFRLLQEQLGERLDLPASAITEAVIDERLRGRNLPQPALTALHELFQACNQARYAPQKSSQELAALIPVAENVIRELRQLKA